MGNYLPSSIDQITRDRYELAGFGGSVGIGKKPALLVIDVQYRTTGTEAKPLEEAVEEFPTAVGAAAWDAVPRIAALLKVFRSNGWPVLFPHVAPKKSYDAGTLGAKIPAIMAIEAKGYEFANEVVPLDGEIMLPKKHPSAFFGTPLASYLVGLGVDSLVVVGCSTSGCVRSTVVDAFSFNFKVIVPHDAVYDRSPLIHEVNLFDMDQKYADVMSTSELIESLG